MGTTAQKGAYLNQTKMLLKDKINALGGSIDDETTFREYANQLDDIYEAIPKTEYQSGSEVNLGKTIKGKLDFKKEYQAVEYIGSDGHQHIDTGVKGNGLTTNYEIDFETKSLSDFQFIISARTSSSSNRIDVGWGIATMFFGYSDTSFNTSSITANTRYLVKKEGNKISRNGTNIATIGTPVNFETPVNFVLFANNTNGTIANNALAKLFSCKIYNGDTLVRDFIPCYRISDNVIGLYDKVEGKFYTNAGTGTFTKGADVGNGFDEIVGIGQSSQETTTGTQRINSNENIAATGKNGVTYSLQDGLFTFNGTASAGFDIMLSNKVSLEAGAYTMAPSDESGSYTGVFGKYAYVAEVGAGNIIDGGQVRMVANKTLENDYNNKVQLHLYIASGATFNNYKFKVNLVKGTYTSATIPSWEKYTGGYQSPSPNWEQQVKRVAGRNKLKNPRLRFGNVGITLTENDDGTIILNGTNTSATEYIDFDIDAKKGVSYAVSFLNGETVPDYGAGFRFNFYNKNNQNLSDVGLTGKSFYFVNLAENSPRAGIWVQAGNTFDNVKLYPQVEEKTFTPYSPYNTINGIIADINFCPTQRSAWGIGQYNQDGTRYDGYDARAKVNALMPVPKGQPLYVTTGTNDYIFVIRGYDENRNFLKSYGAVNNASIIQTISSGVNVAYLGITIYNPNNEVPGEGYTILEKIENGEIKPFICLNSLTNKSFEPYNTPKTYQLSLGDYEFHGIGNCRDKILCDLDNGKVYKYENVGKYTFTGNEGFSYALSRFQVFGLVENIKTSGRQQVYCNRFPFAESGAADYGIFTYYTEQNGYQLYIYDKDYTNANDFKAYLANNETYFLYMRNKPVYTEITGTLKDQIIAWCKAHSTNETTIIEMDGDLPLLIEVRGLKGAA